MKKSFLMTILAAIVGAILITGAAGCARQSTDQMNMNMQSTQKAKAGVSGEAPARHGAAGKKSEKIIIQAGKFVPARLTAKVGDTVTWINEDSQAHDVHANDDAFQSSTLEPGQSFSQKFTGAGEFGYHDHLHEEMKGTIMVE